MKHKQALSVPSRDGGVRRGCFRLLAILCATMASILFGASSKAALFEDSMSMETTPIEFEMAGARYRIPRNYIYSMDNWAGGPQKNVSLRLVVPDLKPFSSETEACMRRTAKSSCRVYDVEMVNNFTLSEVGFENSKDLFLSHHPKKGVYGFDLYEIGPENARDERYRKVVDGREIVFDCLVSKVERDQYRICDHVAKTVSGAYFYYHFPGDPGLKDAIEVDNSIRDLIDSFSIKGK